MSRRSGIEGILNEVQKLKDRLDAMERCIERMESDVRNIEEPATPEKEEN